MEELVDDEALEVDSIHSELNNFIDCPQLSHAGLEINKRILPQRAHRPFEKT